MSSWRIKVGNDPTVEEWLKAQKSKSGSVQFLIKIFAHLHGNSDITKMSFDELFETDERSEKRCEATGEAKYEVTGECKGMTEGNTGERSEQRCIATATKLRVRRTGEHSEQRYEVNVPMEKVVATPPLPVEKKSQEQREPSQKEKKKDNMLLSML